MNEASVTRFLKSKLRDEHHPLIKYMLVEGIGLESEGWKITVAKEGLCFQTPTLVFYPENDPSIISSIRYLFTFAGFSTYPHGKFQQWDVKALDRKEWWLKAHPNAEGPDICMEYDPRSQPDPFIVARALASMINGYVVEEYEAELWGDVRPEDL